MNIEEKRERKDKVLLGNIKCWVRIIINIDWLMLNRKIGLEICLIVMDS